MNQIDFHLRFTFKFLVFLMFSSCLTPIDFRVENNGGTLVISGQISTIQDQNIIQLGRTANSARLPIPLSGATIQLYDDAGHVYLYEEDFENLGTYYLKNVVGIAGRTYYIQIDLIDGGSYKSSSEKLPEAAKQESVYYKFVNKEISDAEGAVVTRDYIELFANTKFTYSNESIYLKWGVEEAFIITPTDFPDPFGNFPSPCFVVQNVDPQRIVLFNGSEVTSTSITKLLVGSRIIDWSFLEHHYFTIYQSSITKEAYEYWRKVNIVANQVGTIFDTPPGTITGNIMSEGNSNEKALGYFQATNQTFDRFGIYPADIPFPLNAMTCKYFGNDDPLGYPTRCLNCASVRNSSYIRPDWF